MRQMTPKQPKQISPAAKRRAMLLVANTAILIFIYFGSQGLNQPILSMIVTLGYWLVLAALVLAYFIYNRAFTRKGVTAEMLPPEWSAEQKDAYVKDGEARLKKSSWMLAVIIPLAVTVMLDAVYLFTWPMVQNLFSL